METTEHVLFLATAVKQKILSRENAASILRRLGPGEHPAALLVEGGHTDRPGIEAILDGYNKPVSMCGGCWTIYNTAKVGAGNRCKCRACGSTFPVIPPRAPLVLDEALARPKSPGLPGGTVEGSDPGAASGDPPVASEGGPIEGFGLTKNDARPSATDPSLSGDGNRSRGRAAPPLGPGGNGEGDLEHPVVVPRTGDNIYSRLEARRNELFGDFVKIASSLKIPSEVTHSPPYATETWVQWSGLEYKGGRASSGLQRRLAVKVSLAGKEFYQYPIEYAVLLQANEEKRSIGNVYRVDRPVLESLVGLLRSGKRLRKARPPIFRKHWFQLWRPKNRLTKIRASFLGRVCTLLFVLGILGFVWFGNMPRYQQRDMGFLPAVGVAFVLAAIVIVVILARRRYYYVTSGKPRREPRHLKLFDCWQVILPEIGSHAEHLRGKVRETLRQSLPEGAICAEETIWYWGLDGKIEKQQLIVDFRRAIAFIHVYAYGNDLYIGWDAHMNEGQWIERDVARGYLRTTGDPVVLRTIEPGRQPVTEYDLQDTTCLAEWCHAQVVRLVKVTVKEHNIDREIDFSIIRGSRAGVGSDQKKDTGEKKRLFGLTRARTGRTGA